MTTERERENLAIDSHLELSIDINLCVIDKREDERNRKKKYGIQKTFTWNCRFLYSTASIIYPHMKKNGLMILLKIEDDLFVSNRSDREFEEGKKNVHYTRNSYFELLPFKWGFGTTMKTEKKNLGRHIGNNNNPI